MGEVEKLTSSLDYLIANAAFVSSWSAYEGIGDLYVLPDSIRPQPPADE